MGVLDQLEPKSVMHWFEEISSIPRGSLKEGKIAAFIMDFAAKRGLDCSEDAYHNVVVRKNASPGKEDRPGLIFQSHMDMVCAKDQGVEHDFEKDGLALYVEDDKIRANGTTLGADNGIGVAYQLAILDDDQLEHPAIEAVFTTAEEVGMVGASHFDAGQLKGTNMINFDAGGFTEGRIYVGCAGNQSGKLVQKIAWEPACEANNPLRITVGGLCGGHSGGDIAKGRGNGSVILGRILAWLSEAGEKRIASFGSGDHSQENKNGIPAECFVVLYPKSPEALRQQAKDWETKLKDELSDVDEGVKVSVTEENAGAQRCLSHESVERTAQILALLPNGVQSMQRAFPDTPECSCNIGNVELEGDAVVCYISVRSCKGSLIDQMCGKYRALAELTGCALTFRDRLPGWDYDRDSRLRRLVDKEYNERFGAAPRFKVTHASTECGMFKEQLPHMDIISMGPIIYEEHTPREYMGIQSVGVVWEFVKSIISQL